MRRIRFKRGVILWAVIVLGALLGSTGLADPGRYEPWRDSAIGINVGSIAGVRSSEAVWKSEIEAIHAAGFRELTVIVTQFADSKTGSVGSQADLPNSTRYRFPGIEAAVATAKRLDMTVTLNPFLQIKDRPEWRGTLNYETPRAKTRFWDECTAFVSQVSSIAERHGVDRMHVGTEPLLWPRIPRTLDHGATSYRPWTRRFLVR